MTPNRIHRRPRESAQETSGDHATWLAVGSPPLLIRRSAWLPGRSSGSSRPYPNGGSGLLVTAGLPMSLPAPQVAICPAWLTGSRGPGLGGRYEGKDLAVLDEFAVGLAGAWGECGEPEHIGGGIVRRECPGHVVEPGARRVGVDEPGAGGVDQDVPTDCLVCQLAGPHLHRGDLADLRRRVDPGRPPLHRGVSRCPGPCVTTGHHSSPDRRDLPQG
jgi:hypothetical protein